MSGGALVGEQGPEPVHKRAPKPALGKIAYDAYRASTGGHSAVTGEPLPGWEDVPAAIREAWVLAADAVRRHVTGGF